MLADADQKSVLLRLHDQIDEARAELSAAEIAESFRPPIEPLAVEGAIAALVQSGLVVSISQSPTRYRISRVGINEIERTHDISTTINPGTGIIHRSYSERASRPDEESPINWTKWGVILTAIAIAVAILIAVVS
ncbi:hypothetical protein [Sphingomonas oligophenolica]|uniref:hypothetical protein n=1 Tax=Sphingomonas oligophenolica TaxID=301154 RepID=UPI0011299405|nr:hypothetical protein [Sphingomonas oligophenolica]